MSIGISAVALPRCYHPLPSRRGGSRNQRLPRLPHLAHLVHLAHLGSGAVSNAIP